MAKHTILNTADGKRIAWSALQRPSLQDVLDTVKEEYPDVPLDKVFVQDFLMLTLVRNLPAPAKRKQA